MTDDIFTSECTVELLDHMGTDLDVVNDARVSFNKRSEWKQTEVGVEIDCESRCYRYEYVEELHDKDKRLLKYLADHNHWSPFAHSYLKFRITCPIPVARQLMKHTVGLAVNEESRRYVAYTPKVFRPEKWRAKVANKKQGSSETETVELSGNSFYESSGGVGYDCDIYEHACRMCVDAYTDMLATGVCEEQARLVLPQSAMVQFVWSGSLAAFIRVVKLRSDPSAQLETRQVASKIANYINDTFPESYRVYFGAS